MLYQSKSTLQKKKIHTAKNSHFWGTKIHIKELSGMKQCFLIYFILLKYLLLCLLNCCTYIPTYINYVPYISYNF